MTRQMVKSRLAIRISQKRHDKLRLLSIEMEKTITQLIEDAIDEMPEPKRKDI